MRLRSRSEHLLAGVSAAVVSGLANLERLRGHLLELNQLYIWVLELTDASLGELLFKVLHLSERVFEEILSASSLIQQFKRLLRVLVGQPLLLILSGDGSVVKSSCIAK